VSDGRVGQERTTSDGCVGQGQAAVDQRRRYGDTVETQETEETETRLIFRIEYKRLHEEKKTKHGRQPSLYTQFSQLPYVLLLILAQLTYVHILTYVLITTCKDPALTTLWGLDRQRRLPWERALLLALPPYSHFPVSSHFRRTHAPLVVTLPAYS